MIWVDAGFAAMVALLFTVVLVAMVGWRHPTGRGEGGGWAAAVFLFLLFLFGVWAIGAWASPVGPPLFGGYWLPFVAAGVVIAMIVIAATAAPEGWRRRGRLPNNPVSGVPTSAEEPTRAERRNSHAALPDDATSAAVAAGLAGIGVLFWVVLIVLAIAAVLRYVLP